MNYIDLTLPTDKDTTNYNELTNQPQINDVTLSGNKSLSDLGINQPLPDGYEITVKQDGTGDFTDIQSAINSLTGKYSAGKVTINIGAGTYNVNEYIQIVPDNFNFSELLILGHVYTDTIIKGSSSILYQLVQVQWKGTTPIYFKNLTLEGHSNLEYGLFARQGACVYVQDVKAKTFKYGGFHCYNESNLILRGAHVESTNIGVLSSGTVDIDTNTALNFTNLTTGLQVRGGGIIRGFRVTKNYTSVTNEASQVMGSSTSAGYISVTTS